MMGEIDVAEPAISAATVAAGISAATLAILGVPSLALLWGLFGAVAAVVLFKSTAKSRWRVIATVLVSGLIGAAAGNWFAASVGGAPPTMILAALIVGAGAKRLLSMAITAVGKRVETAGGSHD